MADFCKQCSIENFGEDLGDLKDLRPGLEEGEGWPVLCEGPAIVNNEGECIDEHCLKKHGRNQRESKTRNN